MVVGSLNEGFYKQELSGSQKQSILTLLYKKGPKTCLDNWRPISLLNVDYKIAACALSRRLKGVIGNIISRDQSGFMKKRSALENVRLVQDVIDYCELEKIQSILMFIDFKQAFDNVNHSFLFDILKKYGFKDSFIIWIQTLYKNACGRILNYGWLSNTFSIQKGVRQGCPLSALLFILVVEALAVRIKENNDIQGLNIPHPDTTQNEEIKIVQYADDTVIFVNSLRSMRNVMKEINNF